MGTKCQTIRQWIRDAWQFPVIAVLALLILISESASAHHCKGKHANDSGCGVPPPPDPELCEDEFPSFTYRKVATRKTPAQVYMASSDGCRRVLLSDVPVAPTIHFHADRTGGTMVWREETLGNELKIRLLHFSATAQDIETLSLESLTLFGPDENQFRGYSFDLWGDATHATLYLAVAKKSEPVGGGGSWRSEHWLINLHDVNDRFKFYDVSEDDCIEEFPQSVATCYSLSNIRWNASGKRLYMEADFNDAQTPYWSGAVRFEVTNTVGLITAVANRPSLVVIGTRTESTDDPHRVIPRPSPRANLEILPSPELVYLTYLDRLGNNTEAAYAVLNADECVDAYQTWEGFDVDSNLWFETCVLTDYDTTNNLKGEFWQSENTLLGDPVVNRRHRIMRSNILFGTGVELIDRADNPDTGL